MIVSEARREANRRNAQKSTGPRTDAGKAASRRNAVKHGLTATTVEVDAPEVRDARARAVAEAMRPGTDWERWVCSELAAATLRLDRAAVVERAARDAAALRAGAMWDEDRKVEAERLGGRLAADPAQVVARLRTTPHGCDWLSERWALLHQAISPAPGRPAASWTEGQRQLAFDLLGTPPCLRPESFPIPEAEIARTALVELHAQRDRAAEVDAIDRDHAERGLADAATPELRRIRRYEAALHRRLGWCLDQMSRPDPAAPARPAASNPTKIPVPPPTPAATPIPPFSNSQASTPPAAPGSAAILPATAGSPEPPHRPRLDSRLRKAEARRAAKQRKCDRLLN